MGIPGAILGLIIGMRFDTVGDIAGTWVHGAGAILLLHIVIGGWEGLCSARSP